MEPTIDQNNTPRTSSGDKINKFVTATLLFAIIVASAIYIYGHTWVLSVKEEVPTEVEAVLTDAQKEQILAELETSNNNISDAEALRVLESLKADNTPKISEASMKDIIKSL